MKLERTLLLLLTLGALWLTPLSARAQVPNNEGLIRRHEGAIRNQYIVVFNQSVGRHEVAKTAEQLARAHRGTLNFTYEHALRGFAIELNEAQAIALSRNPLVAYIEEDAEVIGASTQTTAPWGLDRIDQRALPLNTSYTYANAGAGVNVYVIDGGIRITHQEFGGRAVVAYDNVLDGRNGVDCNGHGTHVAGIIGGNTYGVAKGAKLWSVRVLNCQNQGTTAKVIAGIDWVTGNHAKPALANLSFISVIGSDAIDTAVRNSVTAGVTYVVAAGNTNLDAGTRSPARVAEAITVAASDANDTRASFSNFGSVVDVFAPGVDIVSANSFDDTSTLIRSGTSSAAPFVAGVAARYLSGNPQATPAAVSQAIIGNATQNKVVDAGAGTPNRLLYRPQGKIAFSSNRDGNVEIYTMNADGSEQTRLTTHDYSDDMWPEYSPDGTKIAFTSGRGDDLYYQIYVMNADGSNVTRITNSRTGHCAESAWSPDGKQIAFRSNRDGGDWEIYAINVDGTNERRLTNSPGWDLDPAWSPDGKKIAFETTRDDPYNLEIYTMNADGTNQVNITNNLNTVGAHNDYYPAWSSDGSKIAFVFDGNGTDEIYVMNADGSGRTNVSNLPTTWEYNPSWASDDSKLVFQSDKDDGRGEIYVMDAIGGNITRLTFNTGNGVDPTTADDYYPDWQAL
jgi:Tol biopolymer transport system component